MFNWKGSKVVKRSGEGGWQKNIEPDTQKVEYLVPVKQYIRTEL